jgi:biotin transporter BioY
MQGTLGAPFFSRFGNGLTHLLGPTGGYLFGFLGAMIFIATSKQNSHSRVLRLVRYWFATMIIFCCGLTQLAWFVSPNNLFSLGLYPFILGDFLIKPLLFFLIFDRIKVQQKFNNEK